MSEGRTNDGEQLFLVLQQLGLLTAQDHKERQRVIMMMIIGGMCYVRSAQSIKIREKGGPRRHLGVRLCEEGQDVEAFGIAGLLHNLPALVRDDFAQVAVVFHRQPIREEELHPRKHRHDGLALLLLLFYCFQSSTSSPPFISYLATRACLIPQPRREKMKTD